MLLYLLDTDICSYAIKRKEAALLGRIREGLIAEEIAISVITRGELLYGLALLPEATSLARAVHAFLDTVPCLDWNKEAANRYAPLRAQQKDHRQPHQLHGYPDRCPRPRRKPYPGDQQRTALWPDRRPATG